MKRQPRDSIRSIQEKHFYTTRIRVRQRYGDTEVGVVEEKKSLVEDNNPMYLEGVRRNTSQHLLVFQAIAKSKGWSSDTAALQLFAHLDGEALQVALLVLNRNREYWRDIANELLSYYNWHYADSLT